jgi:MFS family permease
VLVASFIGTTIEWYDFFLYGTAAALVFNRLFFPTLDALAGTLSAYGTFAVGFVARPLGGAIFGHYGDRLGRKQMLVWSLVVMGFATALIGVIPTYDAIGIWSPFCWWRSAFSRNWRGWRMGRSGAARGGAFDGSAARLQRLVGADGRSGWLLLATGVFAVLSSSLSESALLSWGWRIPFLLSVVLIAIGLFVRLRILETPSFARVKTKAASRAFLARRLSRASARDRDWDGDALRAERRVLHLYGLRAQLRRADARLSAACVVARCDARFAAGTLAIPLWSHLSDRIGRKPVYLFGVAFSLLIVFPFFWLMERGTRLRGACARAGDERGPRFDVWPDGRLSVRALRRASPVYRRVARYQLTSVFSGGVAPFIATLLLARYGSGAVAAYVAACCVITAVAGSLAPETHRVTLDAESTRAAGYASRTKGSG